MQLKVCGMRDPVNMQALAEVGPDWVGLIFYPASKRYAGNLDPDSIKQTYFKKKVGVFVNSSVEEILTIVHKYRLDLVQLHGDEDLDFVKTLHEKGIEIIKVFRVTDSLPNDLSDFSPYVTLFLFDTYKKETYGGTGIPFDWSILSNYSSKTSYLLSGGIGEEELEKLLSMHLPGCIGIDVNSAVEVRPGLKSIEKVKAIKSKL
ncbi:MAG: phosphoribosylanthranilate isomerase [Paraglaciecola sp.]|jgi:phosphoribosylanthranilate isomerase